MGGVRWAVGVGRVLLGEDGVSRGRCTVCTTPRTVGSASRRHDAHSTYLRRVLLSVPVVGLAQPARLAEPPLVRVALEGATSAALHTVRTVAVDLTRTVAPHVCS